MRNIAKRRGNEPLKSPSPDIANRSQIKTTRVQVDDIKHLLMKAKQKEKQFQMESSFSYLTSDKNSEQKNKFLREQYIALKDQFDQLVEQNRHLGLQIMQLREKKCPLNHYPKSNEENEEVIRELKERLIQFSDENKRLIRKMQEEREKSQHLTKDNEFLKNQIFQYKANLGISSTPINILPAYKTNNVNTNSEDKLTFNLIANQMLKSYSDSIEQKFGQLQGKMKKVQFMEKLILARIDKIDLQKTPNSLKHSEVEYNTTAGKADSSYKDFHVPSGLKNKEELSKNYNSPFDKHLKQHENTLDQYENQLYSLKEELIAKESELFITNQRCYKLQKKIQDYEKKDKSPLGYTHRYVDAVKNIQQERSQIVDVNKRNQLIEQNRDLKERFQKLSNDYVRQKNDLGLTLEQQKNKSSYFQSKYEQIKNAKTEISQNSPCLQCTIKQNMINDLHQRLKQKQISLHSQQSLRQKQQQEINDLRLQILHYDNILKQNSQQLAQLNNRYHQDAQFAKSCMAQLRQYILIVQNIRQKLKIDEVMRILEENKVMYGQLEGLYFQQRKQFDDKILQMRKNMLLKEQKIIELERINIIYQKQIEQLQIEKNKLKQAINNFKKGDELYNSTASTLWESKRLTFSSNNQKIVEFISVAEEKLDVLYKRINEIIEI